MQLHQVHSWITKKSVKHAECNEIIVKFLAKKPALIFIYGLQVLPRNVMQKPKNVRRVGILMDHWNDVLSVLDIDVSENSGGEIWLLISSLTNWICDFMDVMIHFG